MGATGLSDGRTRSPPAGQRHDSGPGFCDNSSSLSASRAGVHHATPNLPDAGRDRCCRGLRSVTQSAQTLPLRICVFGTEIDEAWLRSVASSLPARAFLSLFGAAADTPVGDARVARHAHGGHRRSGLCAAPCGGGLSRGRCDPAAHGHHAAGVLVRAPAACDRRSRRSGRFRSGQCRCGSVATARGLAQRRDATDDRRLVLCARPSSADRLANDLPPAQRLVRLAPEYRPSISCATCHCRAVCAAEVLLDHPYVASPAAN